jgi:hypothetical protein
VNGQDVRVIQRGDGLRFALESLPREGISEVPGEKLDGDVPIEFGVDRTIDDTHPTCTDHRLDAVWTDVGSRFHRRGIGH